MMRSCPSTGEVTHVVGMDIAKETHVAHVMARDGTVVLKRRSVAHGRAALREFSQQLLRVVPQATTVIAMEATGHYWVLVEAFLVAAGWRVVVFNPVVSAAAAKGNPRGRVSDADDARTIAVVVRDGVQASQVIDPLSAHLRELTRRHTEVTTRRTADMHHLQALVEVTFPEFITVMKDLDTHSARAVLRLAPHAELILTHDSTVLCQAITTACRGRINAAERVAALKAAAATSLARGRRDPGREALILVLVDAIARQTSDLDHLDDLIRTASTAIPADQRAPFQGIPGAGPTLTPALIAEFGDLRRFTWCDANGKRHLDHSAMTAFAGCDPRICDSGTFRGQRRMSKRGSPYLRRALMLAASGAAQRDAWCKALYHHHKKRCPQRGHWLALTHVARHLIHAIAAKAKYQDTFTWERFIAARKDFRVA
jgi:transposase